MKKQKSALSETLKQEFKKDLELFEYFLVLLNSSSPIRNVELMWAEDLELFDPMQRPRVNTGDALVQLQVNGAAAPGRSSPSPSTHFCDLVHGFGAHEEQTCARSDNPAKERCRATGRSHVYPCHVGLTDIAVPVICEGRYLGTLFSGQVLTEPPTAAGFAQVRKALGRPAAHRYGAPRGSLFPRARRHHRATGRDGAHDGGVCALSLQCLEASGDHARIPAGARTGTFARSPRTGRDAALRPDWTRTTKPAWRRCARWRATWAWSGSPTACCCCACRTPRIMPIARFRRPWSTASSPPERVGSQLALARVAHMIEDRCRSWPNTIATTVTPGVMCIFTTQKSRTPNHERLLLDEMAQALLRTARSQGLMSARIGISAPHAEAHRTAAGLA